MGAFLPFRSVGEDSKRYKAELQKHGMRVMGVVDVILDCKGDRDKVIHQLHELGKKHLTFDAKPEYFDVSIFQISTFIYHVLW